LIVTSNTATSGADQAPLVAAVDVEWTKNYRIRGGNVPFCYSIVWLTSGPPDPTFGYTSAYVESAEETQDLIQAADRDLAALLGEPTLITGHQLCADLSTLANAARQPTPGIAAARELWHARKSSRPGLLLDTRYDIGHLLDGASRRLVDVATEVGLDVTQPELRSTSMTALHQRWLHDGDPQARERITVLNLRHSLSTALLALASTSGPAKLAVNVNELLHQHLADTYAWTRSPAFAQLL
jgi:hypothetical protein